MLDCASFLQDCRVRKAAFFTVFVPSLALAIPAFAAIIGFETIPGGAPSRGLAISDQFQVSDGVTFQMADGSSLLLGDYGSPSDAGWYLDTLEPDTMAEGYSPSGQWFARFSNVDFNPSRYLVVSYSEGMSEVAFDIIDVDFGVTVGNDPAPEAWAVRGFDKNEMLVSSLLITAGDPGTGDGIPTHVSLVSGANSQIWRLELQYSPAPSTTGDPGFGLDNFESVPVPEPTAQAMLGVLSALVCSRLQRRVESWSSCTT